jgi:Polyketide cyclase / dehydrase and lipid transport
VFTTLATIAVLLAVILVSAAMKPATFRVTRTRMIHAGPRKIVPLIEDFRAWRSWSPYEQLDPSMKKIYGGAAKGTGAVYQWEGNGKVGVGRMEIIDSSPSQVRIKLDFIKPFATHNVAEFSLEPKGGSTNVTWVTHGPASYFAKVATTFFSMDRLLGSDFETGLANLKAIAET